VSSVFKLGSLGLFRTVVSRLLVLAFLAAVLAGCTVIQDTPGKKWKGTGIGFDAGYSFGEGWYVGDWELELGFALASGSLSYSPGGSGTSVLMASGQTFSKTLSYNGETITVTGNFVSAGECQGSTAFRGKTLAWTAKPE
jgi:hypothetical protein